MHAPERRALDEFVLLRERERDREANGDHAPAGDEEEPKRKRPLGR